MGELAVMNQDRRTEIIEEAEEAAMFFTTLVKEGVPPQDASALTGSWIMQRNIRDQNDKEGWEE